MTADTYATEPNTPPSILIISEDAAMARAWKRLFEQRNYRAVCEISAREGLTSARLHAPTLILLDLDLPDGERLDLCRELRSTTDGALLMLDSSSRNPNTLEYHRAGVDETISAPISQMALFIKSLAWLARYDWIAPRRQSGQAWA